MRWPIYILCLLLVSCSSPQAPRALWSEGYYNDDIQSTEGYPNGALYRDTRLAVETLDSWHCMFTRITPFDLRLDKQERPYSERGRRTRGQWYRNGEYQLITLYVLNMESSPRYGSLFKAVFMHEMVHATLGKGHSPDRESIFYMSAGPDSKMTPDLYTDVSRVLGTGATPTECGVKE